MLQVYLFLANVQEYKKRKQILTSCAFSTLFMPVRPVRQAGRPGHPARVRARERTGRRVRRSPARGGGFCFPGEVGRPGRGRGTMRASSPTNTKRTAPVVMERTAEKQTVHKRTAMHRENYKVKIGVNFFAARSSDLLA